MDDLTAFALGKLRSLIPAESSRDVDELDDAAFNSLPPGGFEQNDMMRFGDFRGRFEHLYRYSRVAENQWGTVVDIGCGTGYGSSMIGLKNRIIGIDVSRQALKYAQSEYGGPDFIEGSGVAIPLIDSSVDAITCFEVIEHTSDPLQLLEEFRRIMKDGATLFLSTPNPRHLKNTLFNLLFRRPIPAKDPHNIYHVREYSYSEMIRMLDEKGFDLKWTEGQSLPVDYVRVRRRILDFLGLNDCYDWILLELGRKFHPSLSYTILYSAKLRKKTN